VPIALAVTHLGLALFDLQVPGLKGFVLAVSERSHPSIVAL
jgi:hypothetical protein